MWPQSDPIVWPYRHWLCPRARARARATTISADDAADAPAASSGRCSEEEDVVLADRDPVGAPASGCVYPEAGICICQLRPWGRPCLHVHGAACVGVPPPPLPIPAAAQPRRRIARAARALILSQRTSRATVALGRSGELRDRPPATHQKTENRGAWGVFMRKPSPPPGEADFPR